MNKRVWQDVPDDELFYTLLNLELGQEPDVNLLTEIHLRILAVGLGIRRDTEGFFEPRAEYAARMEVERGSH